MVWSIEYFEREDGEQPAEVFEDALEVSSDRDERRLNGKLLRVTDELAQKGFRIGGGYVEPCREAPGVWQIKADAGPRRGRQFFVFDEDRVVLLNGVVKGAREATPPRAFKDALRYQDEYKRTRRVSPEEVDDE